MCCRACVCVCVSGRGAGVCLVCTPALQPHTCAPCAADNTLWPHALPPLPADSTRHTHKHHRRHHHPTCTRTHDRARAAPRTQDYFHDRIAQLTFTFPEDAVTSTGLPFWSAPKRFPRPVVFSAADPAHAAFVQVRACVRGRACVRVCGRALLTWLCVCVCVPQAPVDGASTSQHVPC
jgi:hypothetical protein